MPQSPAVREIFEGRAADVQVRLLGLEPEWLVNAVHSAEFERRNCSALEPATAPGLRFWFGGVRALTEWTLGAPEGSWVRLDLHGLPRVVNKETRVGVTFCAGDYGVGNAAIEPHARHPRGNRSQLLVRTNVKQLALFASEPQFVPVPPAREHMTWWLLAFSAGDELRAELSLPMGLGPDRRFSDWQRRIILDIPPLNRATIAPPDQVASFPVTIKKRA